jgi:hypothetical protein
MCALRRLPQPGALPWLKMKYPKAAANTQQRVEQQIAMTDHDVVLVWQCHRRGGPLKIHGTTGARHNPARVNSGER